MCATSLKTGVIAHALLEGHIIDSLTLSKVLDTILSLGGQFVLNHVSLGTHKKDLSKVYLQVSATEPQQLQLILTALAPYGVSAYEAPSLSEITIPSDLQSITKQGHLALVVTEGQSPRDAFLFYPAKDALPIGGKSYWVVEQDDLQIHVATIDLNNNVVLLKTRTEIKPGDWVFVAD